MPEPVPVPVPPPPAVHERKGVLPSCYGGVEINVEEAHQLVDGEQTGEQCLVQVDEVFLLGTPADRASLAVLTWITETGTAFFVPSPLRT